MHFNETQTLSGTPNLQHRIALLSEIWDSLPASLREADRNWFLAAGGEDYEYEEHHLQSQRCICFDGDTRLSGEQWRAIRHEHGDGPLSLVVMGDLHFSGRAPQACLVTGNLYCDAIHLFADECCVVGGRIQARHYALLSGFDDETLHRGFQGRLSTPHAFFWFHDWREVTLDEDTVVYLVCDQHHFEEPGPPRWFAWQDDLKALRPELSDSPVWWGSHELLWQLGEFGRRMAADEPVFIDDFSPDCLPRITQARVHLRQKQYREAFLHYKAAIALSPCYQPAWAEAAQALYLADALEQAIPYAERAVALMPEKLRHLQNEAADTLALCLLRLHQ
jgi:tetratricopeptide (TPR) repeat protein